MNQVKQNINTIDESKLLKELNEMETSINNAERARIQAETKKEGYRVQYAELNEELRSLGIEPREAKKRYFELGEECVKESIEIKQLIPEGY